MSMGKAPRRSRTNIGTERALDGFQICLVTIGRELDAIGEAGCSFNAETRFDRDTISSAARHPTTEILAI
jgi:hypothetical protein